MRGEVVGDCIMDNGTHRPFLHKNGSIYDLNSLVDTVPGS
ncbi:hypothetical protein J8I87_13835 [Paraburkholderia sp. LEh10]|nr:hypothetical protein [Paraburkholderia sp. LEh10]